MSQWAWLLMFFVVCGVCIYSNICAYYNGVNDGFGVSQEPRNPGYQRARQWLKKYAYHRWTIP